MNEKSKLTTMLARERFMDLENGYRKGNCHPDPVGS